LFFGVEHESDPYCKKHPTDLALSRRPETLGEAQRDLTRKRSKVRGSDSIRLPKQYSENETKQLWQQAPKLISAG
jgi:hypothetical protein